MAGAIAATATAADFGYSAEVMEMLASRLGLIVRGGALLAAGEGTAVATGIGVAGVAAAVASTFIPSQTFHDWIYGRDNSRVAPALDSISQSIINPITRNDPNVRQLLGQFAETGQIIQQTEQIEAGKTTNPNFLQTAEGQRISQARTNAWLSLGDRIANLGQEDQIMLRTNLQFAAQRAQAQAEARAASPASGSTLSFNDWDHPAQTTVVQPPANMQSVAAPIPAAPPSLAASLPAPDVPPVITPREIAPEINPATLVGAPEAPPAVRPEEIVQRVDAATLVPAPSELPPVTAAELTAAPSPATIGVVPPSSASIAAPPPAATASLLSITQPAVSVPPLNVITPAPQAAASVVREPLAADTAAVSSSPEPITVARVAPTVAQPPASPAATLLTADDSAAVATPRPTEALTPVPQVAGLVPPAEPLAADTAAVVAPPPPITAVRITPLVAQMESQADATLLSPTQPVASTVSPVKALKPVPQVATSLGHTEPLTDTAAVSPPPPPLTVARVPDTPIVAQPPPTTAATILTAPPAPAAPAKIAALPPTPQIAVPAASVPELVTDIPAPPVPISVARTLEPLPAPTTPVVAQPPAPPLAAALPSTAEVPPVPAAPLPSAVAMVPPVPLVAPAAPPSLAASIPLPEAPPEVAPHEFAQPGAADAASPAPTTPAYVPRAQRGLMPLLLDGSIDPANSNERTRTSQFNYSSAFPSLASAPPRVQTAGPGAGTRTQSPPAAVPGNDNGVVTAPGATAAAPGTVATPGVTRQPAVPQTAATTHTEVTQPGQHINPPNPPPPPPVKPGDLPAGDNGIHFDFDSTRLDSSAFAAIKRQATAIRESGFRHGNGQHIRVDGNTDAVGSDIYNVDLSRRRASGAAAALVAELRRQGVTVDNSDIEIVASGKNHLVEQTQGQSRTNRRVDISVTGNPSEPAPAAQTPPPADKPPTQGKPPGHGNDASLRAGSGGGSFPSRIAASPSTV